MVTVAIFDVQLRRHIGQAVCTNYVIVCIFSSRSRFTDANIEPIGYEKINIQIIAVQSKVQCRSSSGQWHTGRPYIVSAIPPQIFLVSNFGLKVTEVRGYNGAS